MTSPFAPFGNATLVFQVDSGALSQSPDGVSAPIQQRVTVLAVLADDKGSSMSLSPRPQSVPATAILFKGFLVSPLSTVVQKSTFERLVTDRTKCRCTINGVAGQFWLKPFVMDPFQQSVGVFIASELGGWFAPGAAVTIVGEEATA